MTHLYQLTNLSSISVGQRVHRQRRVARKVGVVQDLQVEARGAVGPKRAVPLPDGPFGEEKGVCPFLLRVGRKVLGPHSSPGRSVLPPSHLLHAQRVVLGKLDLQDHDHYLHYHNGIVPKSVQALIGQGIED